MPRGNPIHGGELWPNTVNGWYNDKILSPEPHRGGLPIWRGGIISVRVLIDLFQTLEVTVFMLDSYGLTCQMAGAAGPHRLP
jgi:hypothetical protein